MKTCTYLLLAKVEPRSETSTIMAGPRARSKNDGSPAAATGRGAGEGTAARSASSGEPRRGRASNISDTMSKASSKKYFTHQVKVVLQTARRAKKAPRHKNSLTSIYAHTYGVLSGLRHLWLKGLFNRRNIQHIHLPVESIH